MEVLNEPAGVIAEDSPPRILGSEAFFASTVGKTAANGGFVLIDGNAGTGFEVSNLQKLLMMSDSGGSFGAAGFGPGDLTGSAEWRFARFRRRMFRVDAWGRRFGGRVGRRRELLDVAWPHKLLDVSETEMAETGVPE